jgi:hypothetical protein
MVINCTAEMEHKPQKIYVVVAAAEKYIGVQDFPTELLQGVLNGLVLSSQAAGLVYDQM